MEGRRREMANRNALKWPFSSLGALQMYGFQQGQWWELKSPYLFEAQFMERFPQVIYVRTEQCSVFNVQCTED